MTGLPWHRPIAMLVSCDSAVTISLAGAGVNWSRHSAGIPAEQEIS
jgi:hypothetical protein